MNDKVVDHSTEAINVGSKSFAAAAKLFDERTRQSAVMLYAWCRHCDDVIDGQTLGHDQQADFRTRATAGRALPELQGPAHRHAHFQVFQLLQLDAQFVQIIRAGQVEAL